MLPISNRSVATSGNYERFFEIDGKKYCHIIDPRTGYSATSLISATVIAESATQADALATAVFVLGPEDGLKLAESLFQVEALLITEEKEIIQSSSFPR